MLVNLLFRLASCTEPPSHIFQMFFEIFVIRTYPNARQNLIENGEAFGVV